MIENLVGFNVMAFMLFVSPAKWWSSYKQEPCYKYDSAIRYTAL